jgi:hypothetical protein
MEDNVPSIKIKYSQPDVGRKGGRPRLEWLDSVSKKDLGLNSWWKKKEIMECKHHRCQGK